MGPWQCMPSCFYRGPPYTPPPAVYYMFSLYVFMQVCLAPPDSVLIFLSMVFSALNLALTLLSRCMVILGAYGLFDWGKFLAWDVILVASSSVLHLLKMVSVASLEICMSDSTWMDSHVLLGIFKLVREHTHKKLLKFRHCPN